MLKKPTSLGRLAVPCPETLPSRRSLTALENREIVINDNKKQCTLLTATLVASNENTLTSSN
jgi:hypothetical protein